MSMDGNYVVFLKNDEIDQSKDIQQQFDHNQIDFPSKLNVTVTNTDSSRSLRTSKKITSYLLRDISSSEAAPIKSFEQLSQRINKVILENIRKAGCINDVTVEGEFQNQINKYSYESLDLKFRLTEDPILSTDYGFSIDSKQRNCGLLFKPSLTNLFGQCETISLRLRKSLFDFNKEHKVFTSFTFPYFSPDSFIQEYELGMSSRQTLNDLRTKMFKFRNNLYSQKDPRWKYGISTTSHHFTPSVDANNVISQPGSIFDQTMQTYQNLVFKTTFTQKNESQTDNNITSQISHLSGKIGIGSNNSVFAKAKYYNNTQTLHELQIGDLKTNTMSSNRFQLGGVIANKDLHFIEKSTLVNQPSFKNIDLKDKNINSSTIGSQFYMTNQFKYYFLQFPFLQKLDILPFFHAYAAFVPTNMKVDPTNKNTSILKQNLRATVGLGLTYEINDFDKVDFIYSFADLVPKQTNDEFCKFSFSFYS